MHAKLCADNHQGISHIVTGISHIGQLHAFDPAKLLTNSQHICQHLGRMKFIGQTVPYRNPCISCQLLYDILSKATVLDTIIHSAKNPCRICYALLFSDLGA